jgi:hypothetical protein
MRIVLATLGMAGLYVAALAPVGCGPTRCEDTNNDVISLMDEYATCTTTCTRVETPVPQSTHPSLKCAFAIGEGKDPATFTSEVQELSDDFADSECEPDPAMGCPMGIGVSPVCSQGHCILN